MVSRRLDSWHITNLICWCDGKRERGRFPKFALTELCSQFSEISTAKDFASLYEKLKQMLIEDNGIVQQITWSSLKCSVQQSSFDSDDNRIVLPKASESDAIHATEMLRLWHCWDSRFPDVDETACIQNDKFRDFRQNFFYFSVARKCAIKCFFIRSSFMVRVSWWGGFVARSNVCNSL